jgi:hypothetical protein
MNADPLKILILRPWNARRRSVFEDLTLSEQPFVSIRQIGTMPEVRDTIAAFRRSLKISTVQCAVTDM